MSEISHIHGALARSLTALTLGAAKDAEDVQARDASLAAGDMTQNVQLEISGAAVTDMPSWVTFQVLFPYQFINSVDRRRSQSGLAKPHFVPGYEVQSDVGVILHAQVRSWIEDDDTGFLVGATVALAAWSPGSNGTDHWSGTLHMSFTGYGAAIEDEAEA